MNRSDLEPRSQYWSYAKYIIQFLKTLKWDRVFILQIEMNIITISIHLSPEKRVRLIWPACADIMAVAWYWLWTIVANCHWRDYKSYNLINVNKCLHVIILSWTCWNYWQQLCHDKLKYIKSTSMKVQLLFILCHQSWFIKHVKLNLKKSTVIFFQWGAFRYVVC